MNFKELSIARYSLRKFDPRPVEDEKLKLILEAGISAPTAKNYQPQRIFVIKTPEALAKADRCTECHFHPPVVMIVGYDASHSWKQDHAPHQDYGAVDASIAATHMMLQATDIGVGNIWIGLFDPEKIYNEFPETKCIVPIGMLFFGYPAEGAKPSRLHTDRKTVEEIVTFL